eukprot:2889741-Pyramimonas_sp.AAC.1
MRQTDASDVCESTPVITCLAAHLQSELSAETDSTSQDDSNNTIVLRSKFGQQTEFRALDSTDGRA